MGALVGIPILATLAMLQSAVLSTIPLIDGHADVVMLAVIGWTLTGRARQAMIWGLVGGLMLDLFSGLPFGFSSLALISVAYVVSLTEGRFWEANLIMPLGAVLIGSLIFHAFGLLSQPLMGRTLEFENALTRIILPSVFLNLLLALPVSQLAEALENTIYPPKVDV